MFNFKKWQIASLMGGRKGLKIANFPNFLIELVRIYKKSTTFFRKRRFYIPGKSLITCKLAV